MTRSTFTRRAAVGGFAVLTLTSCGLISDLTEGDDPTEEETTEEETTEEETTEEETTEEGTTEEEQSEGESDGSTGEGTEVQIGESFTDEELGDTITVVSALRDMPSERHASFIEEGGEVFYVQIEISPGEYSGAIGSIDFLNTSVPGQDKAEVTLATEMRDQGYEPLETYARTDGDSPPLWLAFTVHEERQDTYTLAYVRPEASDADSGEPIPEFRHEFEIPAG